MKATKISRYNVRETDLVQADADPTGQVLKYDEVFRNGKPSIKEFHTWKRTGYLSGNMRIMLFDLLTVAPKVEVQKQ